MYTLVTIALLVLTIPLPIVIMIGEAMKQRKERLNEWRGFEVKINAGEVPAAKEERENDHG